MFADSRSRTYFPKRSLRLIEGQIRLPLGLQVKAWFGIKNFAIPMPSNIDFEAIREVRILPRNGCFYAEFVYPDSKVEVDNESKVCSNPHGKVKRTHQTVVRYLWN
jgi:hypothetical protein